MYGSGNKWAVSPVYTHEARRKRVGAQRELGLRPACASCSGFDARLTAANGDRLEVHSSPWLRIEPADLGRVAHRREKRTKAQDRFARVSLTN